MRLKKIYIYAKNILWYEFPFVVISVWFVSTYGREKEKDILYSDKNWDSS